MEQEQHKKFTTLKIIATILIVALLGWVGWQVATGNSKVSVEDCEFPQSATDLRAAGQKLSEEITGTVGYSADGKLTIDSTSGFVLLTPIADEADIISKLREQITENLGCEGTTALSYWVFEVSDPNQLPPEILEQLGTDRPNQILIILGSLYVFNADSLVLNSDNLEAAVTRIVTDRGGPLRSRTNSTFTQSQNTGENVDFETTPDPAPLERGTPETSTNSFGTNTGGTSSGSGSTGGGTPTNTGGGYTGGNTGGGSQCTLKVSCEDPVTGALYDPGVSGCQGADFYSQTPPPPQGTRQIAQCVYSDGTTGSNCPEEYWFYYRNCVAEANSLDLAGQNAVTTPEEYDAISGTLPANSPSEPGTLFTVPPTYPNSPVNYTVRCSYPDQTKAIQCGMPGSGEYCLPGYNPVGCVAPAADFETQ